MNPVLIVAFLVAIFPQAEANQSPVRMTVDPETWNITFENRGRIPIVIIAPAEGCEGYRGYQYDWNATDERGDRVLSRSTARMSPPPKLKRDDFVTIEPGKSHTFRHDRTRLTIPPDLLIFDKGGTYQVTMTYEFPYDRSFGRHEEVEDDAADLLAAATQVKVTSAPVQYKHQ
jgi:hypothetical protein